MEWVFEADAQGDFLHELFGVAELFGRAIHLQAQEVAIRGLVIEPAEKPAEVRLIDSAFVGDLFQGSQSVEVGGDVTGGCAER